MSELLEKSKPIVIYLLSDPSIQNEETNVIRYSLFKYFLGSKTQICEKIFFRVSLFKKKHRKEINEISYLNFRLFSIGHNKIYLID